MSPRIVIALGLLAVLVSVVVALAPRAETANDRVTRLASELRCPVCQGLSVQDSPSDTAREMRALVQQRVSEGRTDDEIRREFRQAYGDWIFLSPPLLDPRGAIWLVPLAVILAGGALVASRFRRGPPAAAPTSAQLAVLRERTAREASLE